MRSGEMFYMMFYMNNLLKVVHVISGEGFLVFSFSYYNCMPTERHDTVLSVGLFIS